METITYLKRALYYKPVTRKTNKHLLTNRKRASLDCTERIWTMEQMLGLAVQAISPHGSSRVLLLHMCFISDAVVSPNTCKNIKRPEKLLGLRRRPGGAGFFSPFRFLDQSVQLCRTTAVSKSTEEKQPDVSSSSLPSLPRDLGDVLQAENNVG